MELVPTSLMSTSLASTIAVYSVTQLNRYIKQWLESDVGVVDVEGEISNVSQPSSGHVYFTLKDSTAQLRCVYFKPYHPRGKPHSIEHGQKIVARGRLSVYEARGDYQLIVENVALAGQGDLSHQFELLKIKCAAAGLFDPARKRVLPKFPRCIGVVTSASAAAWRDIMVTLARRYPLAPIILYPSDVQGKLAPEQLCNAIARANQEQRCDVLILARGGGSLEDLWAFNDESLAHVIYASNITIVSGIGHETDFTIADFVADYRAATPTAAAEAATPAQEELLLWLGNTYSRLVTNIRRLILQKSVILKHQKQLLIAQHPKRLVKETQERVKQLQYNLISLTKARLRLAQQQFTQYASTLHAVSPLATLERGYSVVMQNERIISNSKDVNIDESLKIKFARGELICRVSGTNYTNTGQ